MGKLEVDQQLIRELAALLDETGLTEIEVCDDASSVRIARNAGGTTVSVPLGAVAAPTSQPSAAAEAEAEPDGYQSGDPGVVTSPMVGTAYLSPEPSAPAYVNVGDSVSAGQTLLIIEAMKTFNEIPAPHAGRVKAVLFENQAPVEFGDVLMVIE